MIEGVGDEEDGGGDSGGIATGTQKRGSKQGEALTSACFTLERGERWTDPGWKKAGQTGRQTKEGEKRKQETAICKVPERQDIRQTQLESTARGWQQSGRVRTHEAAGRRQTAATRRHHCTAQAASDPPRVGPVTRLHPKT